jgi:hypothetical protein
LKPPGRDRVSVVPDSCAAASDASANATTRYCRTAGAFTRTPVVPRVRRELAQRCACARRRTSPAVSGRIGGPDGCATAPRQDVRHAVRSAQMH